ncbi:MAG: VWA domain-containing protein [Ectothiorhodospiraceae bacterium]|nr:VWA domain-containing protein [Ectothiorhodospiraceae bacterium]
MSEFHFLRPLWLLGVAAVPALLWLAWRGMGAAEPWRRACDPALLAHLVERTPRRARAAALGLAALVGIGGALALAGPTWSTLDVPVGTTLHGRVVALDLSRSMLAVDVVPSRLDLARAKVDALLRGARDGQVGLVVFAGDAFAVAPMTTDARALAGLLPAFDVHVVPTQGSRPDRALEESATLLREGGSIGGEVILVSDGAKGDLAVQTARRLAAGGVRTSVLAVGTEAGGRVPLGAGRHLQNPDGTPVLAPVPFALLQAVAEAGGGRFAVATPGDTADVVALLAADPHIPRDAPDGATEDDGARIWLDRGPWLALALVPLAALGFRRGWLLGMAGLAVVGAAPPPAMAETETPPERLSREHTEGASPQWDGVWLYRDGRYLEAAEHFGRGDTALDHYNRGNALARAGLLRAALAAYAEALVAEPSHEDARFNHALVAAMLDEDPTDSGSGAETADVEVDGEADPNARSAADARPRGEQGDGADDAGPRPTEPDDARGSERREGASPRPDPVGEPEPEPPPRGEARARAGLTPSELERLEQVLAEVSEDRLGLWRRKLQLQAFNRRRQLPDVSSAW